MFSYEDKKRYSSSPLEPCKAKSLQCKSLKSKRHPQSLQIFTKIFTNALQELYEKKSMSEKKLINFRLSVETINKLEELAKQTGKTKTAVIEEAINCLANKDVKQSKDLQILKKQNIQLQQALQGFQIALQGKDELLKEKDERIKELKETIEILKHNQDKKTWWKFWK